jgi:hypothetical protein
VTRDILQPSTPLPQFTGEMVSEVAPVKIHDFGSQQHLIKRVPSISPQVASLERLKDPTRCTILVDGSQGTQRGRVQRNMQGPPFSLVGRFSIRPVKSTTSHLGAYMPAFRRRC